MSKNCVITLYNEHDWTIDDGMLSFVLQRIVARHAPQARVIDIYPQERVAEDAPAWKHPGWLEWTVRVLYHSGGAMTIGCIQRTVDAEFESHS
jgi:hypothetical protein